MPWLESDYQTNMAQEIQQERDARAHIRSALRTFHFDIQDIVRMIWLFLILALSAVSVSLVGLATYFRIRRHMKEASSRETHGKIETCSRSLDWSPVQFSNLGECSIWLASYSRSRQR